MDRPTDRTGRRNSLINWSVILTDKDLLNLACLFLRGDFNDAERAVLSYAIPLASGPFKLSPREIERVTRRSAGNIVRAIKSLVSHGMLGNIGGENFALSDKVLSGQHFIPQSVVRTTGTALEREGEAADDVDAFDAKPAECDPPKAFPTVPIDEVHDFVLDTLGDSAHAKFVASVLRSASVDWMRDGATACLIKGQLAEILPRQKDPLVVVKWISADLHRILHPPKPEVEPANTVRLDEYTPDDPKSIKARQEWHKRRFAAEAAGRPFDEPMPT